MASLLPHHRDLTDGEGKCSVPMWSMGVPAGFCDTPAYGPQLSPKEDPCASLRYDGYVPGLACYSHGGPREPAKRETP